MELIGASLVGGCVLGLFTGMAQAGNIAYQTGRTVRWDGEGEQFEDDPEAAKMLDKPRRSGYDLPEV